MISRSILGPPGTLPRVFPGLVLIGAGIGVLVVSAAGPTAILDDAFPP